MGQGQRRIYIYSEGQWIPAKGDIMTGAMLSMSYEHHKVHDGGLYGFGHYAVVGTGSTLEIRWRVPPGLRCPHILFEVESDLGCVATFYKDTTKTHVAGNLITPINHNDNFETDTGFITEVCHTPAGSGNGTLKGRSLIGGGRSPGNRQSGHEFVGKPGASYLLICTSANNNTQINASCIYYDRVQHNITSTTTTTTTTTT